MIPPPKCQTVWPHPLRPDHIHRCIRDENHDRRGHLCMCGARLMPETVITPAELDPAVRAEHRRKIAETLDAIKLCALRKDRP